MLNGLNGLVLAASIALAPVDSQAQESTEQIMGVLCSVPQSCDITNTTTTIGVIPEIESRILGNTPSILDITVSCPSGNFSQSFNEKIENRKPGFFHDLLVKPGEGVFHDVISNKGRGNEKMSCKVVSDLNG